MKKTLFFICALALNLTASAQIFTTPKGKLIDNMYRNSDSWVKKGWTSMEPGKYEGLASKIVEGDDGYLYVYNPLSGFNSNSWLKLEKVGEGRYKAVLPQIIFKDNDGGDDDDEEGGNTERIFKLNHMIATGKDQYKVVEASKNYMEYTWDGKTLKMLGAGSKNEILGVVYGEDEWESRYGDWNVTIHTSTDKLITPPSTAQNVQYTVTSRENTSPRLIDAAVEGNDIYLKGLFKSEKLANVWVKITRQGDKAVMLSNQYLGVTKATDYMRFSNDTSAYHTYAAVFNDAAAATNELEFSVNAATGVLTANNILKIMFGKSSATNMPMVDLESYEELVLTPYQAVAGKPETPKLHYCSAADSYDYTQKITTLAFYVKNVSVDGKYLNPEKMYYNIYLNDSKTPFTFEKSRYYYLEKDITDIPFNYSDKKNDDIKKSDDQRILHFYDPNIENVTVIMVYEEGGKKYLSAPMSTVVVTAGIENITANDASKESYFTVDGRRLQQLQKGLNIVKRADGTTKKVLVK